MAKFFAVTTKGLEPVLAKEMAALNLKAIKEELGGVRFEGNLVDAYRANLWLRTANRVLMSLIEFDCFSEDALYEGVRRVDWRKHLNPKMTLAVDANVKDSKITHSKYAALKVKDAVVDQLREKLGARPNVDTANPDVRINLHLHRNRAALSLDMSGDSLHKRGYRVGRVEAPLKETLAAGIVELTEWDCKTAFVDPMCGSGTILIEAAMKAARIAPGLLRRSFGFQRWLHYDREAWRKLVGEAEARRKRRLEFPILGFDISARAIDAAKANAEAAGVAGLIAFEKRPIDRFDPIEGPGVVVLNPPYGERLGEIKELEALYKTIGDTYKQKFAGFTGFIFTGNLELAKRVGLRASRRIVLFNGPIESRLLRYELYR